MKKKTPSLLDLTSRLNPYTLPDLFMYIMKADRSRIMGQPICGLHASTSFINFGMMWIEDMSQIGVNEKSN